MHPKEGYLFKDLTFSTKDKESIEIWLNKIKSILKDAGISQFPMEDLKEDLKNVSIANLKDLIVSLRSPMIEMSLIHHKIELSKEYVQLKEIIESGSIARQYLEKVEEISNQLDLDLKIEFKKFLNEVEKISVNLTSSFNKEQKEKYKDKLESYTGYSDFKPLVQALTGEHLLVGEVLNYLNTYETTKEEMFAVMKQQVLSMKAKLPELVNHLGTDEINVREIKDLDPVAYQFLTNQAFEQFWRENYNMSVRSDKPMCTFNVHPGHELANSYPLKKDEMAIVTASIYPIRSLGLKKGDIISSKNNPEMKFEVITDEEQVENLISISHLVNESLVIKVMVPVYFFDIKARLIRSQRQASIKIS